MKRYWVMGLVAALAAAPVWASGDSREKQMLRRMQQQVQQSEQARVQAEQDKAAALADRDSLEREVEKLKGSAKRLASERTARARAEADLKAAQAEIETLKTRLAETEGRLAESQAQARTTAGRLAETESAKKQTESVLSGVRGDLRTCGEHNGRLYTLSRELMDRYRDKTCQDALAQAEPFTGLKKVEVENLLETWRDRADEARLTGMAEGQAGTQPR